MFNSNLIDQCPSIQERIGKNPELTLNVCTDSRTASSNSLFIAIKGEKIDLCAPEESDFCEWANWFNDQKITQFLEQGKYPNTINLQKNFYKKELYTTLPNLTKLYITIQNCTHYTKIVKTLQNCQKKKKVFKLISGITSDHQCNFV